MMDDIILLLLCMKEVNFLNGSSNMIFLNQYFKICISIRRNLAKKINSRNCKTL
jgi:hypothetical protein